MALTKNMAYDHPAYTGVETFGSSNTAGASSVQGRFAAFTNMLAKSFTASVITAGTGTGNATLARVKVTAGTSTSTLGSVTMGTAAAGVTTNVLCTASGITAGDVVWVQAGADATGVWAVGIEMLVQPGASITP